MLLQPPIGTTSSATAEITRDADVVTHSLIKSII